ncbi:hypothetical protein [Microbacterium pseudoresistens]|uniref:Uncharacterized protein n=1 Tax=Microbacterium pseudoresistens TaxID=640634 RepID=A0A7Y9EX09_9MICO|nr:hypothetical protein [Microbacterium pseudoresistens]NYD54605.1 hypothetical protein [Microbacterium pseudoresistens]
MNSETEAKQTGGVSRRTLVKAGVWAVPVVAAAVAVPAQAASTVTFALTNTSSFYDPLSPDPLSPPYDLYLSGDLSRTDGQQITQDYATVVATNSGDTRTWYVSGSTNYNPYPFSTFIHNVSGEATSFTLTIDGEVLGPFPIDPPF